MQQKLGKWSLRFAEAPFILESSSVVGTKEADGPLGGLFDIVGKDDRFGQNTWEKAESSMQRDALTMALGKAHLDASDMDYVFAGDLLGQSMATTFGVENFRIPWFGVYGACSTCGESLSLAAAFVAAGYGSRPVPYEYICSRNLSSVCKIFPATSLLNSRVMHLAKTILNMILSFPDYPSRFLFISHFLLVCPDFLLLFDHLNCTLPQI